jgi:hypothetical protein
VTLIRIRNRPSSMSDGATRNTLRKALNAWERVSALRFHEDGSDNAIIQMSFDNDNHYYGDGDHRFGQNILAHGFFPSSYHLGGDVHFNNAYRFTERQPPNSGGR